MIYRIRNGVLAGQVELSGAKNSYLRLLAASLLTDEPVEIQNAPLQIRDGIIHVEMLRRLGKEVRENGEQSLIISETEPLQQELNWDGRSIRNTLLILGALTTRFGSGAVPLPGGCKLGERKYDLHISLLQAMGAEVREEEGYLITETNNRLRGAEIILPIRSTGATENAILCATLAEGKTTVRNPHIRPEIMDLIAMLRKMGAKIEVFGQERIEIEGVDHLSGCHQHVISDNMEALTWLTASVITGGEIEISHFPFKDLEVPLIFLRESGALFQIEGDTLYAKGGTPYPLEISTGPYPGINSDMQPLLAVYGAMATGETRIVDLRFPGRYQYAEELAKMGPDCEIRGNMLLIRGGGRLSGAQVTALDLRAGAALSLAALKAEGETTIYHAEQVERGYNRFVEKFRSLGGQLEVSSEEQ